MPSRSNYENERRLDFVHKLSQEWPPEQKFALRLQLREWEPFFTFSILVFDYKKKERREKKTKR